MKLHTRSRPFLPGMFQRFLTQFQARLKTSSAQGTSWGRRMRPIVSSYERGTNEHDSTEFRRNVRLLPNTGRGKCLSHAERHDAVALCCGVSDLQNELSSIVQPDSGSHAGLSDHRFAATAYRWALHGS